MKLVPWSLSMRPCKYLVDDYAVDFPTHWLTRWYTQGYFNDVNYGGPIYCFSVAPEHHLATWPLLVLDQLNAYYTRKAMLTWLTTPPARTSP